MSRILTMWVDDVLKIQTDAGIGVISDPAEFLRDIPGYLGWSHAKVVHIWCSNSAEIALAIRQYCPDFLGIWNNGFVYPVWQTGGFRTFLSGGARVIVLDLRAFAVDATAEKMWENVQKIEEWIKGTHQEAFTAGMLAKAIYNNNFFYTRQMRAVVPDPIYVVYPSDVSRALQVSYHGGRVEAVEVGKFPKFCGESTLWHVDVNSLYPYLMRGNIPFAFAREERNPHINLRVRRGYEFGLVECSGYIVDDCPFGPLAVPDDHGLGYPVGDFDGIYTIDELRAAQDWIEDLDITYAWWWRSADLFGGWVDHWYRQKRTGNPVAKIMLNSLYGKFAQHDPSQTRYISQTEAWTEDHQSPMIWAKRTNPVISTAITARGRMLLWRAMMDWHAAGGRVLYVDTDSIWGYLPRGTVPSDVLRVSQGRLGSWKIVDDCKDVLAIYGRKMYIVDDEVRRMSGLPLRAVKKNGFYEWETGPQYDDFTKDIYTH